MVSHRVHMAFWAVAFWGVLGVLTVPLSQTEGPGKLPRPTLLSPPPCPRAKSRAWHTALLTDDLASCSLGAGVQPVYPAPCDGPCLPPSWAACALTGPVSATMSPHLGARLNQLLVCRTAPQEGTQCCESQLGGLNSFPEDLNRMEPKVGPKV